MVEGGLMGALKSKIKTDVENKLKAIDYEAIYTSEIDELKSKKLLANFKPRTNHFSIQTHDDIE